MRLTAAGAAVWLTAMLAGCATVQNVFNPPSDSVRRGAAIAESRCSTCHAVGDQGQSPRPPARPFRNIAMSYSEAGLVRELEAVGEVGHYQMPPTPIAPVDAAALAAYIHSLADR